MPNVQLHPDGWIFIRTDGGVYQDTPENLEIDSGVIDSFEGMTSLFYNPDVKYNRDEKPIISAVWEIGDNYISKVAAILAAQAERLKPPDPTLEELKQSGIIKIQEAAEGARGRFITTSAGKVGEYTQKRGSYDRWEAAGQPDPPSPSDYPIAEAERVVYDPMYTLTEMLQVWGAKSAEWDLVSAVIAPAEQSGKFAVEAAGDAEAVAAAIAAAVAELEAIKPG